MIQSLIRLFADNIFFIIYGFATLEAFLVILIGIFTKRHERKLLDTVDNLVKGFSDSPDKDSNQSVHEKFQAILQFVRNSITKHPESKSQFLANLTKVQERSLYSKHYRIEVLSSVMSTLVQVFPLLGILGTILAIAQTASPGATIDTEALSVAFVLAMDTTILGILFSILFMVIESALNPKIERVIDESKELKNLVSNLQMMG